MEQLFFRVEVGVQPVKSLGDLFSAIIEQDGSSLTLGICLGRNPYSVIQEMKQKFPWLEHCSWSAEVVDMGEVNTYEVYRDRELEDWEEDLLEQGEHVEEEDALGVYSATSSNEAERIALIHNYDPKADSFKGIRWQELRSREVGFE